MSNINLLEAMAISNFTAKIDIVCALRLCKMRKDRSSFRIMCSWAQRTWKTSQKVDPENTFKLFSSRR